MEKKGFEELTNKEYTQLQVFRKLKEYSRLKNNELSFDKGYTKNDILWYIYNIQKEVYIKSKDYMMAGVVYNRMYEILKKEKQNQKALNFLICCLYLKGYDNYFSERHLEKFIKDLETLLKKNDIDINIFESRYTFIMEYIKEPIKKYLPFLYNDEKISIFQQKINQLLST